LNCVLYRLVAFGQSDTTCRLFPLQWWKASGVWGYRRLLRISDGFAPLSGSVASLSQVDIQKHQADSADRGACRYHVEVGKAKSEERGEERYGVSPECGNVADKGAYVSEKG